MGTKERSGFTLAEILTALVVVAVLTAIAIPMWRAHLLRVQRAEARDALLAVQAAQDHHFGRHARYASQLAAKAPEGLGLATVTPQGHYQLSLTTSPDGLGFLAIARATGKEREADSRCAEFSLDHVGQMRARDSSGADRSADCWH